jgi:6-phosphofructo-2-kinase
MVGLPARGKSYICKKLAKYLSWCGFNTRVFNVGNRRRVTLKDPAPQNGTQHDATFFDASNQEAFKMREALAMESVEELLEWLDVGGGKVAIHDATNSTVKRRLAVRERALKQPKVKVFFIESICPDPILLEQNIRMKLQGPDYQKMDPQEAIKDFKNRIANYEKVYQTISEEEEKLGVSYIKLVDVGAKVIAHHIKGYLPSQCVFYLMQMNIVNRTIWLSRHGESIYNLQGKIGGNPGLSPQGNDYSKALFEFMKDVEQGTLPSPNEKNVYDSHIDLSNSTTHRLRIVTSCLERAVDTVSYFDPTLYDINHVRFLNEIYCGNFEEMTHEELQERHPDEIVERLQNPLLYRYPGTGGESLLVDWID